MLRIIALVVLLGAVANTAAAKNPVASSGTWTVTEVAGQPVLKKSSEFVSDPAPFIRIEQVGNGPIKVGGYSGCNAFGRVIDDGQPESERHVEADAQHCGEDIGVQELNMFRILSGFPRFSFDFDTRTMWVTGEDGSTILAAYAGPLQPELGGKWKLVTLNGEPVVEAEDNPIIMVNIQDGMLTATSQCIVFRWWIEVQQAALQTETAPHLDANGVPMTMCARGLSAREKAFADVIDDAVEYGFDSIGNLRVTSPAGSAVLALQ